MVPSELTAKSLSYILLYVEPVLHYSEPDELSLYKVVEPAPTTAKMLSDASILIDLALPCVPSLLVQVHSVEGTTDPAASDALIFAIQA
jgi:hypothetical protein